MTLTGRGLGEGTRTLKPAVPVQVQEHCCAVDCDLTHIPRKNAELAWHPYCSHPDTTGWLGA